MTTDFKVRNADLPRDIPQIKLLWEEYLTWGNDSMQRFFGVHPHDPLAQSKLDVESIAKFQPPSGNLIVAEFEGDLVGVGSLKAIDSQAAEIKRMYVRPEMRNKGVGREILQKLLLDAISMSYQTIRLDSPKFMEAAHALYRSFGFQEIDYYPEVEIPESFREFMVFMELDLTQLRNRT